MRSLVDPMCSYKAADDQRVEFHLECFAYINQDTKLFSSAE